MFKRVTIITLSILTILIFISNVKGDKTEKKDVKIDPSDYVGSPFLFTEKGDEIVIKVDSDLPVNIYIVTSADYLELYGPDVEKAKYSEINVTSTEFTYEIPDDQLYYIVITNSNSSIATVDYEYSDIYEEEAELFTPGCSCLLYIFGIIVIISIILFFIRKKMSQLLYQYPFFSPRYQPHTVTQLCPTCKKGMRYNPQLNRWYCDVCNKYK